MQTLLLIYSAVFGLNNKLYKMHGTYIKIVKNRELHLRKNDPHDHNNDDDDYDNNKNVVKIKKMKRTANSDYLNYLTR
jgi:hypothetical protein